MLVPSGNNQDPARKAADGPLSLAQGAIASQRLLLSFETRLGNWGLLALIEFRRSDRWLQTCAPCLAGLAAGGAGPAEQPVSQFKNCYALHPRHIKTAAYLDAPGPELGHLMLIPRV